MAFEYLIVRREGPVGWLEYNRPPINAFSAEMTYEVPQALDELLADKAVRVIVIASAVPSHFSAGADLRVFDGIGAQGMRKWVDHMHGIVRQMRGSAKPLLAAIHGTAVGGGLEITLHCDVRFAAEDARMGQPEINIAFIPPVGTTQALARLLGRPRAIRYLYEGTLVSAQEALQMGLVDLLVPPARLREEVQAYGEGLAAKPAETLAAIRRTIGEGIDRPFEEGLQIEHEAVVELGGTENFAEGVRAFLEKRPPRWR